MLVHIEIGIFLFNLKGGGGVSLIVIRCGTFYVEMRNSGGRGGGTIKTFIG